MRHNSGAVESDEPGGTTGMDMPVAQRASIQIGLVGAFDLRRDGRSADVATPAKRVLAFLALSERAVPREQVASVLWLGSNDERAAGSLRSALWKIRQCGDEIIETTQNCLRIAAGVRVDIRDAIAWARRVCDGSVAIADGDLHDAFVSGELLPNWSDEWVVIERERLRQMRFHALETLVQRLVAADRYGDALELALTSLRTDPLRESAHRAVISVHLAEGNASEAVRHYRGYRDLLRSQLGIEPSDLMKRMVNALDSGAHGTGPTGFVTAGATRTIATVGSSLDATARAS